MVVVGGSVVGGIVVGGMVVGGIVVVGGSVVGGLVVGGLVVGGIVVVVVVVVGLVVVDLVVVVLVVVVGRLVVVGSVGLVGPVVVEPMVVVDPLVDPLPVVLTGPPVVVEPVEDRVVVTQMMQGFVGELPVEVEPVVVSWGFVDVVDPFPVVELVDCSAVTPATVTDTVAAEPPAARPMPLAAALVSSPLGRGPPDSAATVTTAAKQANTQAAMVNRCRRVRLVSPTDRCRPDAR